MVPLDNGFCTNNNPMVCGAISSVGGQSSSTDESDSTISLVANVSYRIEITKIRYILF